MVDEKRLFEAQNNGDLKEAMLDCLLLEMSSSQKDLISSISISEALQTNLCFMLKDMAVNLNEKVNSNDFFERVLLLGELIYPKQPESIFFKTPDRDHVFWKRVRENRQSPFPKMSSDFWWERYASKEEHPEIFLKKIGALRFEPKFAEDQFTVTLASSFFSSMIWNTAYPRDKNLSIEESARRKTKFEVDKVFECIPTDSIQSIPELSSYFMVPTEFWKRYESVEKKHPYWTKALMPFSFVEHLYRVLEGGGSFYIPENGNGGATYEFFRYEMLKRDQDCFDSLIDAVDLLNRNYKEEYLNEIRNNIIKLRLSEQFSSPLTKGHTTSPVKKRVL